MQFPHSRRFTFSRITLAGIFAFLGSLLYAVTVLPDNSRGDSAYLILFMIIAIPAMLIVVVLAVRAVRERELFVDTKLASMLGHLGAFRAYSKVLPRFRFVDLYQAAQAMAPEADGWVKMEISLAEPLSMVLNGHFYHSNNRRRRPAERNARTVGPGQESYFPEDCFWTLPAAATGRSKGIPCVLRVRQGPATYQTTVEVAAHSAADGTALIERLITRSAEMSIYRNALLDLEFAGEVRDDDGNIEQNENFDLVFKPAPAVGPGDIVLEDEVSRALERNVLDFHRRRDALMKLGLPGRRGVLLYGPPGTGKTYTCKYLSSQLAGTITTLVASGESLLRVRTLCNLARMLQPAMIVLEDVDLVFASRESGQGHNASLGKLMDELDGFGRDDRIIFVLTTNAIDRVERAVSDRPGRISQCVFLGPPSDPLRRRYLQALVAPYDAAGLDLDRLTGMTGGTTQAFLKELVFRAVQIASLGSGTPAGTNGGQPHTKTLALSDEHFSNALAEMRGAGGRAGEAIIGFRTAGF